MKIKFLCFTILQFNKIDLIPNNLLYHLVLACDTRNKAGRNEEFYFWISGYVALAEEHDILNPKQLWIINNHLKLVETIEGQLNAQNHWLRGRIKNISNPRHSMYQTSSELKRLTLQIRNQFNSRD